MNFDGDGFDDTVLAAPLDDLFENGDVGSMNVVYGGQDDNALGGPQTIGDQFFSPASGGLPAFKWVFGPGSMWGKGLAAGDFNNDGFSDVAVGAPGTAVDDLVNSGAVYILYGKTLTGISTELSQVFHQDRAGMPGLQEPNDAFGWSLAAGDFNGDRVDDVAIGAPGEDIGAIRDAGAVTVLYGKSGTRVSGGGLQPGGTSTAQLFVQGQGGLGAQAERGDMFGLALTAGNFNGDGTGPRGIEDLVVGTSHEDIGTKANAGAVQVIYGTSGGLSGTDQLWYQGVSHVEGADEPGDYYGCALAAGNFNGDRFGSGANLVDVKDLAVGVPGEDVVKSNQGGVNVLYSDRNGGGLSATAGPIGADDDPGDQYFVQNPGLGELENAADVNERFGMALNAQNLNPVADPGDPPDTPPTIDPAWELAVGSPGEAEASGQVTIIGGVHGDGLRGLATNTYELSQDTIANHRAGEEGDQFGHAIGFGDYDGDGDLDTVIGAPGDSSCGELNETGEFVAFFPVGGEMPDAIDRAGAGLAMYNDGDQIGANNGPLVAWLGVTNNSMTRCDYLDDSTDVYGLSGDPQENAEFTQTIAGL